MLKAIVDSIIDLPTLRKSFKRLSSPALILSIVFLLLTVWSWRKWPDILIDFGRELYVPWELLNGKILYKDIAYLNGPLSPYINALWFKVFGVSLNALVFCNLFILACFTSIIYFIIKNSCNKITAFFSCIIFLTIFAFGHFVGIGNYNFICPYSHEMTHGVVLCFLIISLLSKNINKIQYNLISLAGLFFGMVFLGKGEIFIAIAITTSIYFLLISFANKLSAIKTIKIIVLFLLFSMIPISIFLGYFINKMPFSLALKGIAGTWSGLTGSDVANNPFYKACMGIDYPWQNLLRMIRVMLAIMAIAMYDNILQGLNKNSNKVFLMTILLILAFIIKKPFAPFFFGPSISIIIFVICITATIIYVNKLTKDESIAKISCLVLWSVFAFIMLAKIILNTRIYHYGFVLAMPSAILLVIGVLYIVPEALKKWYGGGKYFCRIAIIILITDVIYCLRVSNNNYSRKNYQVGEIGDSIITYGLQIDHTGYAVDKLLKYISSCVPAGSTLAVFPEGIMINYLSRRVNPIPYISLMPPEISIYGEKKVINSLINSPPNYVILINKDASEYGRRPFGSDLIYGKQIMDWINSHYVPVLHLLDEPLKNSFYGIKMMKLKE
jgi:4-amino-4-deoxy-L-arabinose transferase-like glycosyltransferase